MDINLGNTRATVTWDPADVSQITPLIVQQNDYYAFGLSIKSREPVVSGVRNAYLYNGKELQEETGLYDYGARFYDPSIGRWITVDKLAEDPTQIDLSPYAYVANNPIDKNDPDGNCPNCVTGAIGAGVGALFGAVIEGGSQLYHSGKITSWKAVGGATLQGAVTGGVAGFTGGASLLVTTGASAGANIVGGIANRTIQGKGTTVKDVVIDGVIGAGVGGKLLDKGVKALSNTLTKAELKAVASYEKNIVEHQQKLKDYLADPMKFDNKDVLKNAPSNEIRKKMIAGRAKHLEHEIKTFMESIKKIKNNWPSLFTSISKMEVNLKELEQILHLLLLDFQRRNGNEMELKNDYYWDIDSRELYNPYEEPKNISLGQLTDDWETLKNSVKSHNLIPYDIKRVSNILKALSIEKPV